MLSSWFSNIVTASYELQDRIWIPHSFVEERIECIKQKSNLLQTIILCALCKILSKKINSNSSAIEMFLKYCEGKLGVGRYSSNSLAQTCVWEREYQNKISIAIHSFLISIMHKKMILYKFTSSFEITECEL